MKAKQILILGQHNVLGHRLPAELESALNTAIASLPNATFEEVIKFEEAIEPWLDTTASILFARLCNVNEYVPEDFAVTSPEAELFSEVIEGAQDYAIGLAIRETISWAHFAARYHSRVNHALKRAFKKLVEAEPLDVAGTINYQSPDVILADKELESDLAGLAELPELNNGITYLSNKPQTDWAEELGITRQGAAARMKAAGKHMLVDIANPETKFKAAREALQRMGRIGPTLEMELGARKRKEQKSVILPYSEAIINKSQAKLYQARKTEIQKRIDELLQLKPVNPVVEIIKEKKPPSKRAFAKQERLAAEAKEHEAWQKRIRKRNTDEITHLQKEISELNQALPLAIKKIGELIGEIPTAHLDKFSIESNTAYCKLNSLTELEPAQAAEVASNEVRYENVIHLTNSVRRASGRPLELVKWAENLYDNFRTVRGTGSRIDAYKERIDYLTALQSSQSNFR